MPAGISGGGGDEDQREHRKLSEVERSLPDPDTYARSYQLEAFEKATRENTIVFLETGSGKTLIAVMLLRAYAHLLRKPSPYIAVFLVPTVVLVTQQARVVEMHTDLKVGRFWGEMGVDFWDKATWKQKLEEIEVFVMTPQILLDNLRHSFFKLQCIKLLIFDECHHARGKSPYACIMTEFYHPELNIKSVGLPRIFGMTASPINSKASNSGEDYSIPISELETLMNSKVYTVASESVLSKYIPFSTTKTVLYEGSVITSCLHSHLLNHLAKLKCKYLKDLEDQTLESSVGESARKKICKIHSTFEYCISDLGVWLTVKAAELLSRKENNFFFWGERNGGVAENAIRMFSEAAFEGLSQYIKRDRLIGENFEDDIEAGLLSAKVHCLIKSLLEYRTMEDLRCIIFVERVITAMVLQSLLCNMRQLSRWGVCYMAGSNAVLTQSRNEQSTIIDAFRRGEVNIIIATQILEEGLDVPNCNLVIRFDPSMNIRSYIQSRGRARMRNSEYLLLIRSDDLSTQSKVAKFHASGDAMRAVSLRLASVPCKSLGNTMCEEDYYHVETTGAIVTISSSVALIYFYCSRLPSDGYFKPFPRFVIDKECGRCILYLPKSSPIQMVHAEGKNHMLRQIVCLEACKSLHSIGALNDHLLPELGEITDDEEQIAVLERYKDELPDYFPGELVDSWFSFSRLGFYHCYEINLKQTFSGGASSGDIFLVVKSCLGPDFVHDSFNMEAERGPVTVNMKYIGVIHLSHEQVIMAKRFQITILSVLIHHDFAKLSDAINCLHKSGSSKEIVYLLLPSVGRKVDWCCIQSATFSVDKVVFPNIPHCRPCKGDHSVIQSKDGPLCCCILQNSVVYAPHSGHFYCVTGILHGMGVNSSLKLKDGEITTYKNYYKIRHDISLKSEKEPLLAARHLFTVQNFLLRQSFRKKKEYSDAGVELPPELCKVVLFPISVNRLYFFSFVPSIMHRILCLLLAAGMKMQLDNYMQNVTVPNSKILEAITAKKCREEFSLESLETLGDSFLKYAASQYLFKKYKHHHEGILSARKDKIISNAALCQMGCNRNLAGYIRIDEFNSNYWVIPGFCHDSLINHETFSLSFNSAYIWRKRSMKSKTIADSVEALIGAYLSAAGESTALRFMEWIGMDIEYNLEPMVERLIDMKPERFVNVKGLEELLNYKFHNRMLLVEALTHASYQFPDIPGCYQRLEFLGDAILDHLITIYLYNKYPGVTPGLLTDLRSSSVNNNCYAHAAVKAGLNKHILHASPELHKQMTTYFEKFEQPFSGSSYGWEAGIALPKVLGDVIESIAGAIFIDSNGNKELVWSSIRPLLEPLVTPETVKHHPVRELDELCARKSYLKSYTVTHADRRASITVEVQADGAVYAETQTGPNKQTAKKLAAKAVLECLERISKRGRT